MSAGNAAANCSAAERAARLMARPILDRSRIRVDDERTVGDAEARDHPRCHRHLRHGLAEDVRGVEEDCLQGGAVGEERGQLIALERGPCGPVGRAVSHPPGVEARVHAIADGVDVAEQHVPPV